MQESMSLVLHTHYIGYAIVLISAIVEIVILLVFHETGLFPTMTSIVVGSVLVMASLWYCGNKMQTQGLNFGGDLIILMGQPVYWRNHRKRTIESIIAELNEWMNVSFR
jgi:hypothetical protein